MSTRWAVQDTPAPPNFRSSSDEPTRGAPGSPGDLDAQTTTPAKVAAKDDRRRRKESGKVALYDTQRVNPRSLLVQQQCLKLSMSIFARPNSSARSLGFTSAIAGEGKSFLASTTAAAIASHARRAVLLIDCNWEHPALHALYDVPEAPGLAEWTRGECALSEVRHTVAPHLTVIPAGMALGGAIELAARLHDQRVNRLFCETDEVLIADMPSVLTSAYGATLAQSFDAVALVVRAGVTWDSYIAEAHHELIDASVRGVILNATTSRIPRWLQRIM